jgi:hypothetical protein
MRRSPVVVAALVCVAATAACASPAGRATQHLDQDQSTVTSDSSAISVVPTTYDHITFERPAAWRDVPITFLTASWTPSAYWTNQDTVPECRPHPESGGHTGCGPPITSLNTDGVLVTVIDMPTTASSFHPNTTVGGRPAAVTASRCSGAPCYPGAVRTLRAVIRIPGEPSVDLIATLQLQAFFGPDSADEAEQRMRQMLDDARTA